MMRRSLLSGLLVSVALVTLLAPSALAASSLTLQSGERAVVKSLELQPGDRVDYSWDATGLVEFRIRNEDYDWTVLELTATQRSGTFTASLPGTYTFRFENVADYTITMTYSVGQSSILLILAAVGLAAALAVLAFLAVWYMNRRRRYQMPPPPYMPPPYAPPPQP